MATKYMHTIDGRPAFYTEHQGQICYMNFYGPANPLADSLAQIRREQKASAAYRKKCGFQDHGTERYSYRRVEV